MQIGWAGFEFSSGSSDLPRLAMGFLSRLLYTALLEVAGRSRPKKLVILVSLEIQRPKVSFGIRSYYEPLINNFRDLTELAMANKNEDLAFRVDAASVLIERNNTSMKLGTEIPHEIRLSYNTFSIEPLGYDITMPGCSTSELLIALASVINGAALAIHHNGELTERDRLLIDYIDRATLGNTISFSDFGARDDDPESWFMFGGDAINSELRNIPAYHLEAAIEFLQVDCRRFYKRPIYRGHRDKNWKLTANLFRPDDRLPHAVTDHFPNWCQQSPLLSVFDTETLLQVAQHYGLKTDLLDFTTNPLVACFFALCTGGAPGAASATEAAIFVVDAQMLDNIESLAKPPHQSLYADVLSKYQGMYRDGKATGLSRLAAQDGVFARDAHGTLNDVLNSINEILGLEYEKIFHERLSYRKVIIRPSGSDCRFLVSLGVTREILFPEPNDLEREFERFLIEYPDQKIVDLLRLGLSLRN